MLRSIPLRSLVIYFTFCVGLRIRSVYRFPVGPLLPICCYVVCCRGAFTPFTLLYLFPLIPVGVRGGLTLDLRYYCPLGCLPRSRLFVTFGLPCIDTSLAVRLRLRAFLPSLPLNIVAFPFDYVIVFRSYAARSPFTFSSRCRLRLLLLTRWAESGPLPGYVRGKFVTIYALIYVKCLNGCALWLHLRLLVYPFNEFDCLIRVGDLLGSYVLLLIKPRLRFRCYAC